MAHYSVNIQIDPRWVQQFNENNIKLCMAKVIKDSSGKECSDVIAVAEFPVGGVSIDWTEQYQISAMRDSFRPGVRISASEESQDINLGQNYATEGWGRGGDVSNDSQVPGNAIGFTNKMSCSTLLSMNVGGRFTPVYVSRDELPPGRSIITPTSKVVFWFQRDGEVDTMINGPGNAAHYLELSGGGSANIRYDPSGRWIQ